MDLLPGVRSATAQTARLRVHYLEAGPEDGVPVVLVHGNASTSRFFETVMPQLGESHRVIAPDLRGFGRTERRPIDATRGLRDWADDLRALLDSLGVEEPVHLVGWSAGGAASATYALDEPVASLTLVAPAPPHGVGGLRPDGTPWFPDYAGSGGGLANRDFVERLRTGDRSADSPFSPRNVMNATYWRPEHREPPEREEVLVDEVLQTWVDDDGYPGDSVPSPNWPGLAPGTRGLANAVSPKYCDWSGLVDLDPKPPVLWVYGDADVVVADGSIVEAGHLGSLGYLPQWPGEDVAPPQRMVSETRAVLDRYSERGGRVEVEVFAGCGHTPFLEASDRWLDSLSRFLDSVTPA